MTGLRHHMSQFKESNLSENHSHMSVNEMWVKYPGSGVVLDCIDS